MTVSTTGRTTGALTAVAAVFAPADPPREGRLLFWSIDPGDLPDGETTEDLTVVVPRGTTVTRRTAAAVSLAVADAIPLLVRARRSTDAHPATAFWGAAALLALQLVARGRLVPAVTPTDLDAWRVGPLELADLARVRELAAAMPPQARAVPIPGRSPLELPAAEPLLRAFFDAVGDGMPRTAATERMAGGAPFAGAAPQRVTDLRQWADEASAAVDSTLRISLRIELPGVDADGEFVAVVQASSVTDPTVVLDAAELWGGRTLGPRARIHAMIAVRRAAAVWAPLQRLLDGAVPDRVALGDDEVEDLLSAGTARLADAGVQVHWPRAMADQLTAKAVVSSTTERPESDLRSVLSGDALLSFNWQVALGDDPLTDAELEDLVAARRPVVRLRDRWLLVDPEVLRRARNRVIAPVEPLDALTIALAGTAEVDGEVQPVVTSGWLAELRDRISDPDDGAEQLDPPASLRASLRDYQVRGLRWLHRMTSLGLGACLADDMGLGKTVTLIALHLHRQTDPATAGPTLVVCPASLLGNWEREIHRFAPGTPVRRFHGSRRELGVTDGFVLTTYGTMRRDAARLAEQQWSLVVADEAQHVKNPMAGTAKALRRIPSQSRVALTGTPVENNLSELWAILDWTTPGLLGTLPAFRARWARQAEGGDAEAAAGLARMVAPFLLRRRKSDPGIAPELPPKTETDQVAGMTREQVAIYEAVVREIMAAIAVSDGMDRRGLVLKLLTGLRQVCNHPAHYLRESGTRLAGRSGKLELLDELLDTILAEDGSVLVFTQYVAMARLLERHLADRGVPTLLLHGGTPVARREQLVAQFQGGQAPVFLLSLKAAGTGLNLTRADHVIHYDRWWNPAVEDQATDRAYRIGQVRPVQVHRFVTEGTVEEKVAELLADKRALADAVLGSGESALTELSDEALTDLVSLRRTR
ncbi:MAG TPA: DEAD/DEAH box helicase [Candidatus Nanopelagicales bacterium]|nr:DEAD/DEAH box helicase [Candidatus Nanopelagicales bacterium]